MFTDPALIFNFTFNPFTLLSLIAVVVNLSLLILISLKGAKNEANRWFSLLLLFIVLWGVSEFLVRMSGFAEGSIFWGFVGRPGWVFVSVILFSFALTFIGKANITRSRLYQLLVFGSGFIFLFLSWNTNLISNNNLSDTFKVPWGWDTAPVAPYFWVFTLWLEAFLIGSVVLLSNFYFKTKEEIRKRQTAFIVIAILIPIIGGSITDAFLPIFDIQVMPVAILLTSVMSIIVTYAITRYSLFVISPQLTAKTLIDTMSEALLVTGPSHKIEQVNKATLDLLGYQKKDLIGQDVRKILPDLESWDRFLKKVLIPLKKRSLVSGFETDFRTNDGKRIPVSFSAASIVDNGNILAVVGLARDVRETKKLINRLTAERNKMRVTVSGIADGVFAVDNQGKIILFNQAMAKLLEIGQDKVIGEDANEIIKMTDQDEEKVLIQNLLPKDELFEDRIIVTKKNIKITKTDGEAVYVNLTSSTIAENEDINLGAIVTLHDISKEHELEEMKLDFVSMAAHELRTPLTSIRGYLSVLEEELKGKVDAEKLSFIQKAFISSSQLASLVENLLSVSRIERGRMKIERTMVDWEELVGEVIDNFHDQAHQKEVKLNYVESKKKLPKIFIDRFRMSEVISNLVANAITYTDPGGSVEVATEEKNSEVITQVKDTGQGIPEEALPKLFTKFFRVSGVLEQGSKGTGLGLYISKAIVEMHKGKIWAKSSLGKGSTFFFALPVNASEEEDEPGVFHKEDKSRLESQKPIEPKKVFVKNGKKMHQTV